MTIKRTLYNAFIVCITALHCATYCGSQEITTQNDLNQSIRNQKIVIVKFYSPQCPHCRNFAPIFEQAANKNKNFSFISVNLMKYPNLGAGFNIAGYPTIIYFVNGKETARTAGSNIPDFNNQLAQLAKK